MTLTPSTTVTAEAEVLSPEAASEPAVEPVFPAPVTDLPGLVGAGAAAVVAALAEVGSGGDRRSWVEVASACQSLVNTLSAVQDAAIVEVSRRDQVWDEDGTLAEVVHAPGRVAADAADLVAPALGASHGQAQRRVEAAVRLAANRVPVEVGDRDLPERSGLAGLHTAMAVGDLDAYRACVVAHELEHAPAEVADAVVTALAPHLGTHDASTLRQRTRRLLARICPDLLRQRAERARAGTGLRRWVAEPGVDEWHGTFPSEDAATAWAAIDQHAHHLVATGTCTSIEQARGKALTDLVTGNATIDVQIVLTVPADTNPGPVDSSPAAPSADQASAERTETTTSVADSRLPASSTATAVVPDDTRHGRTAVSGHDDDLVQVQGTRPSEPLLVRRGWLLEHLTGQAAGPPRKNPHRPPPPVPCHPLTGARLDSTNDLATDTYRPGHRLAALVRARDGRCRFPGCTISARFCDLDHVRPWPTGPTTATNLLTLCRRHHRIKQRPGWTVRLTPDGRATFTDPTGRHRTTTPLDALTPLVLAGHTPTDASAAPTTSEPGDSATQPWSTLQTHLQLALEHHRPAMDHVEAHDRIVVATSHTGHRCRTSSRQLREAFARLHRPPLPDAPPF